MTSRIPGAAAPTHVLSIQGEAGSGKTTLALKAPKKLALYSTDHRWDGLVQRHEGYAEKFLVQDYIPPVDLSADQLMKDAGDWSLSKDEKDALRRAAGAEANRQSRKIEVEAWQPFMRDYQADLVDLSVRSHVFDQADELNVLLRLVNFGKLEQNPRLNYGPVNQEYINLIKQAKVRRKVLVLIHQMGDEYKNVVDDAGKEKGVPTGRRVMRWNKSAAYLIDSFVETARDANGKFLLKVLHSKFNPAANGMLLDDPSWVDLMQALAPDVKAEDWGE